jgi:hypothetical protein
VCDPCFILLPPMLLPPCNSDFLPRRPPRRRLPSVLLSPRLPPRRPALPPPPACHRSAAAPRSFYSWTPQRSSSPPPPLKTGNSNLNSLLPLPPPALNRHPDEAAPLAWPSAPPPSFAAVVGLGQLRPSRTALLSHSPF